MAKEYSYGIIPYRITNNGVDILLMKSSKGSLIYNFVKGKIEKDETILECVKREVLEEIGININPFDLEYIVNQNNKRKNIGLYFINWESYMNIKMVYAFNEVYTTKWFNISNLPIIAKNQNKIITRILERFNNLNFNIRRK